MKKNRYIAIMAGGIGSRFWPSSTAQNPKQFLDILGIGKSLIQMTFDRCLPIVPAERILVLTNKKYKDLVKAHLPDLPDQNILCEPSMNNTAPCLAYAALKLNTIDENAAFAVVSSDHVILKEQVYIEKLTQAFEFVETHHALLTLGIEPSRPDTGYGYIKIDAKVENTQIYKVNSFKEKPDAVVAQQYLDSQSYLWNAGIFIWRASVLLDAFAKSAPEIINILSQDRSKYNTANEQAYLDEVYPTTPNISIDYAVMESADNVYTIPADIGWSDLGTWNSLHDFMDKDDNHTVTIGENTLLIDTVNSIVRSDSQKTVVIKGLTDYIVVDEKDALLIYPKSDEQEIKKIVQSLSEK